MSRHCCNWWICVRSCESNYSCNTKFQLENFEYCFSQISSSEIIEKATSRISQRTCPRVRTCFDWLCSEANKMKQKRKEKDKVIIEGRWGRIIIEKIDWRGLREWSWFWYFWRWKRFRWRDSIKRHKDLSFRYSNCQKVKSKRWSCSNWNKMSTLNRLNNGNWRRGIQSSLFSEPNFRT